MLRRFAALSLLTIASASCNARSARQEARQAPSAALARADAAASKAREAFEPPARDGWGRAGSLRYLERVLGGGDATQRLPLLIMIHGMGDAPRPDWFSGAGEIKVPLRLIMPEAPTPYYGGFSWFEYDPEKRDPDLLARGIAAAADKLALAIELLRARRPTVGRAIVAGFSQGGMLSYALALHHSDLVAFSHPIAGTLPEPLWPADKPANMHFPRIAALHGDRDDLVPIAPTRQLHARLTALGYENALREFPGVRHQITAAMEAYSVELLNEAARVVAEGPSPAHE